MDALKPRAEDWTIKEQIVRGIGNGLCLQFEIGRHDKVPRLKIFGPGLPVGGLEIGFDGDGRYDWVEARLVPGRRPGWIRGRVAAADRGDPIQ